MGTSSLVEAQKMYLLYHRILGLQAVKWYRSGGMDPPARVEHLRQ